MTGTPSRTATAVPRGGVGRKLKAKSRPEEHEPHTRRAPTGEGALVPEAQMSSGLACVYAAGEWGEGHASYPGRSVFLPKRLAAPRGAAKGRQKSAEAEVAAGARRRRAEHEEWRRRRAFDA